MYLGIQKIYISQNMYMIIASIYIIVLTLNLVKIVLLVLV